MKIDLKDIDVVAFDADDTLWDNEIYFRESEKEFCGLLDGYANEEEVMRVLYEVEEANIPLFGYGVKSFAMSMLETVGRLTGETAPYALVKAVMGIARRQLMRPVTVISSVQTVLESLYGRCRLVMATKGDIIDQWRKVHLSGLEHYFDHVEIMCDKREADYVRMIKVLRCNADRFLMVGNSLRSDILPVISLGGYGVHIPYHTTWMHEVVDEEISHERFCELKSIKELLVLFNI